MVASLARSRALTASRSAAGISSPVLLRGWPDFTRASISGDFAIKVPLMAKSPEIEARVKSGQPLNNTGEDIPAALREAVNALERAKDATIYTAMKGAMKYMQALEHEEEFIEYLANLLIDLYAIDSALARATQSVRRGDANASMHIKLAQLATWLAFSRLRANLDQMIMSSIDEDKVEKELACVRAYVGDYLLNGVTLQREIAAIVVEKRGYPF